MVFAFAPTDRSLDVEKHKFQKSLHDLIRKTQRTDTVTLERDTNVRINSIVFNAIHFGGRSGRNCMRSNDSKRLSGLRSHHRLFLSSPSLENTKCSLVTRQFTSPTQNWAEMDNIAIRYKL